MERVTGLGGAFFRARDPEALKEWYVEHLGLEAHPDGAVVFRSDPGATTVWAPFDHDTEYFGGPSQHMLNYRVRDLDAKLRDAGVRVENALEESEYGRFGWARDPEGNRIELWEPAPGW